MLIKLGSSGEKVEIPELTSILNCIFCDKDLTVRSETQTSKLLPCLHASCKNCISTSSEKADRKCRICSVPFRMEQLCYNKVLYEIVSDIDLSKLTNKLCSIHNITVTKWCQDCEDFICEECVKCHGLLKSTVAHSIISKDNPLVRLLANNPKVVFPCSSHPKSDLSLYCYSCKIMTCRDCQLEKHKDHKFEFVSEEVSHVKKDLYYHMKKFEYNSTVLSSAIEKTKNRQVLLNEKKKTLIKDIKKEFDKLRKALDKRERELMLSVLEKANKKLDDCQNVQKQLFESLSNLDRCINFVKCVLFTSSDAVIFYTKDIMMNCLKGIEMNNKIPSSYDAINLHFEGKNVALLNKRISEFGTIHEDMPKGVLTNLSSPDVLNNLTNEWSSRFYALEVFCSVLGLEKQEATEIVALKQITKINLEENAQKVEEPLPLLDPEAISNILANELAPKTVACKALKKVEETKEPARSQRFAQNQLVQAPVLRTVRAQLAPLPAPPHYPVSSSSVIQRRNSDNIVLNRSTQEFRAAINNTFNAVAPKTWHIPENLPSYPTAPQVPFTSSSFIGQNIRRIQIPSQPIPKRSSLDDVFDEVLKSFLEDSPCSSNCGIESRQSENSVSPSGSEHESWCSVCLNSDSAVVPCANCPKGFHPNCHIPSINHPQPANWTCLLCENIPPLPPATYHYFRPEEIKIAHRLLLELYCQVEASIPFRFALNTMGGGNLLYLERIKYNLAKGRYVSILKFIADIRMMFVSCYRYRQNEPGVLNHARSLGDIFNRLLLRFIPHLNAQSF